MLVVAGCPAGKAYAGCRGRSQARVARRRHRAIASDIQVVKPDDPRGDEAAVVRGEPHAVAASRPCGKRARRPATWPVVLNLRSAAASE
jgi:hypothetical protein